MQQHDPTTNKLDPKRNHDTKALVDLVPHCHYFVHMNRLSMLKITIINSKSRLYHNCRAATKDTSIINRKTG